MGVSIGGGGIALISGEDRGRKALEFSRRFSSLESSEVDDRVMLFVQLQVNELKLRKERMVINTVVFANLTVVVNIIARKDFSLSKLRSMCCGLFQKKPSKLILSSTKLYIIMLNSVRVRGSLCPYFGRKSQEDK